MPTYVYKFIDTGETIEVQQAFTDDALTEAAHPGSGTTMRVKKVFTPVGVTFKGNGFYKTDSRGKSATSNGSAASKGDSGSTDGGSGSSSASVSGDGSSTSTPSGSDSGAAASPATPASSSTAKPSTSAAPAPTS